MSAVVLICVWPRVSRTTTSGTLGRAGVLHNYAKVMESDGGWQPGPHEHRFESAVQVSWLHKCTDAGREDEPVLLPISPLTCLVLPNTMLTKHTQEDRGYRQCSCHEPHG